MSNCVQKSVDLSDCEVTKRLKRALAHLMIAKRIFDELEITSSKDDNDFFKLLNRCTWELKNAS